MRRSQLRSFLIAAPAFLAAPAAAPAAVNCRIDAVEAVQLARQAGFKFKVTASNATRCELSQSTIVVAAPQARDVRCQFIIFGDLLLENDWKLHALSTSASEHTDLEIVKLEKGWRLEIFAPRGQTSRVNIRKVVLRGEKCADWRQAFGD